MDPAFEAWCRGRREVDVPESQTQGEACITSAQSFRYLAYIEFFGLSSLERGLRFRCSKVQSLG